MPCRRCHCPVRIDARLMAQIDVVTNAFLNRTPPAASLSICGVFTIGSPMQPSVFQRQSSTRMKTMLGCCAGLACAWTRCGHINPVSDTQAIMIPMRKKCPMVIHPQEVLYDSAEPEAKAGPNVMIGDVRVGSKENSRGRRPALSPAYSRCLDSALRP